MLRPPLDKIWIFIIFFRQENRPFLMATMAAFFFVAVVVLDETFDCVKLHGGCVLSDEEDFALIFRGECFF